MYLELSPQNRVKFTNYAIQNNFRWIVNINDKTCVITHLPDERALSLIRITNNLFLVEKAKFTHFIQQDTYKLTPKSKHTFPVGII